LDLIKGNQGSTLSLQIKQNDINQKILLKEGVSGGNLDSPEKERFKGNHRFPLFISNYYIKNG